VSTFGMFSRLPAQNPFTDVVKVMFVLICVTLVLTVLNLIGKILIFFEMRRYLRSVVTLLSVMRAWFEMGKARHDDTKTMVDAVKDQISQTATQAKINADLTRGAASDIQRAIDAVPERSAEETVRKLGSNEHDRPPP
jgi:hypothetical protein